MKGTRAASYLAAAANFAKDMIKAGYQFEALYEYCDINGILVYCRVRYMHPDGNKWIRPIYFEDGLYYLSEPNFERWGGKKPLYGLHLIAKYPNAKIWIVEGEKCADKLNEFFIKQNLAEQHIAITSGCASSANKADWRVLYA